MSGLDSLRLLVGTGVDNARIIGGPIMNSPDTYSRSRTLARLSDEAFDVVVIGAGVAGACTAWDAAMRGLRVALVEKTDFASGASAHSLKILHGGIRYLQHLDFERLRESCNERSAFLRIAPRLTQPLPVAVPTYGWGMKAKWPLRGAFTLLELLTRDRNRGIPDPRQHIPRPFMLTRREILEKIPALDPRGVTGAGVFFDGQIADPTGLVHAIVRSAQEAGAAILNYCVADRLLTRNGRVEGLAVTDRDSGRAFDIRAPLVADLTGPFARRLSATLGGRAVHVPLSRDMAFVVRRDVLPGMALALQTRFRDPDALFSRGNRHLFLCPWRDRYTLIGVNSRVYDGNPYELAVNENEIQLFVDEIRDAWPALELRRDDVTVVNAGLLPFGENDPSSKDLSFGKRSPIIDHGAVGGPQGLFTGMAVRWTMGRLLGERLTDMFLQRLERPARPCRTSEMPVWDAGDRPHWNTHQGPAIDVHGDRGLAEAPVRRIVREEMVLTLRDLVLRRLDVGTGECPDRTNLESLARIAGDELGWSAARRSAEVLLVERSYPFASPASQELLSDAS